MNGLTWMSKSAPLSTRIGKARVTSAPEVAARAKRGIEAYTQAMAQNGTPIKVNLFLSFAPHFALVAELVDALDSKSSFFGSVGSIPTQGTQRCLRQLI